VVYYGSGNAVTGVCAFGDRVRSGAAELVESLKRRGMSVWLISGDGSAATASVASRIGASEFLAEALPAGKVEAVRRLQASGLSVAMVGDGVNDAPALAQADLGIAMSSGTDIAMKAAPVVIMGGRMEAVLDVFDVARVTLRTIRQNLWWAFAYNTIAIALAVAGVLNPIIAAAAMVLSSASVLWNSRRLKL
jgi:P-type E1-E2 ATPase